jgi:hypothetical protein
MTYKLTVGLVLFWVLLAMVTAVGELRTDVGQVPGVGTEVFGFANRAGNPEEVTVDQPGVGTSGNPIGTVVSYGKLATGWLVFLGRAAVLQSSIWEPWTNIFRVPIAIIGVVFLFVVAKEVMSSMTNFIGSIFGRATP